MYIAVMRNPLQSHAEPSSVPRDLADKLRAAVRKSRKPLLTIADDTGIGVATLSEFMAGADMRLSTASKLAAYLKLDLKGR
jgi:hypothetical protein